MWCKRRKLVYFPNKDFSTYSRLDKWCLHWASLEWVLGQSIQQQTVPTTYGATQIPSHSTCGHSAVMRLLSVCMTDFVLRKLHAFSKWEFCFVTKAGIGETKMSNSIVCFFANLLKKIELLRPLHMTGLGKILTHKYLYQSYLGARSSFEPPVTIEA